MSRVAFTFTAQYKHQNDANLVRDIVAYTLRMLANKKRLKRFAVRGFYRLCRAHFGHYCEPKLRQNPLCSFIVLHPILRGGVCWCNFVTPLQHHFHHLLTHIRGLSPLFVDTVLAHLLPFSGKHIVCVRNSEKPFLMCFENTLVFYRSSDP